MGLLRGLIRGVVRGLRRGTGISIGAPPPPSYIGAGANTADIVAIVVPGAPGTVPNDVEIMTVQTSAEAATLSDAQGFVETPSSPQSIGPAATPGSTRLTIFWRRFAVGLGDPTVADSGNHQLARRHTIRGCVKSGSPLEASSGNTGASSTSVVIPGLVTSRANCLIMAINADAIDAGGGRFSAASNPSLTGVAQQADSGTANGTGGGIAAVTGIKTAPGTVGNTTGTLISASQQARICLALRSY